MGCCGYDFGSVAKVKEAIRKNTIEFRKMNSLEEFRDRVGKWDLRSGVCRNVIMSRGKVFCPLHPAKNKGRELRKDHCDINYLCLTAKRFLKWDRKKQKEFLKFISDKKLGCVEYSIGIDNGKLLKEFSTF